MWIADYYFKISGGGKVSHEWLAILYKDANLLIVNGDVLVNADNIVTSL